MAQNVGIKTTSPQAALDVNGDVVLRAGNLSLVNGQNNNINTASSKFSIYIISGPTTVFNISGINGGVDGRIITLYNSTAYLMVLQHLQLSDAANQIHTGTGTDFSLSSYSSVTLRYMSLDNFWHILSSHNDWNPAASGLWTADGNNIYNSNPSNVGIGINNPNAKLSVARGTGVDGTAAFFGTDNVSHFNYGLNQNTYIRGGRNDIFDDPKGSDVYINDIPGYNQRDNIPQPGGNVLLANGGGNVGINLDYPTWAKLQISGRVGATVAMFGSDAYGLSLSANNPEIGFNYFFNGSPKTIKQGYAANLGMNPSTGDLYLGNFNQVQSTSDFGDISGYQYRMVIKQNGNVGIGTTNPTYKLAVDGNIRSKEVVIESVWADYVFDKGYRLRSLEEVSDYIKANGHLPGIPSAKEIISNGLHVGNVQAKMMEKIEELTLYIIDLKKEIELLKTTTSKN